MFFYFPAIGPRRVAPERAHALLRIDVGLVIGEQEEGIVIEQVFDDRTEQLSIAAAERAAGDESITFAQRRVLIVMTARGSINLRASFGQRSDEDLVLADSALTFRHVVITDRDVLGKTVSELNLDDRFGVAVTRLTRADLEMSAVPGLRLQFGDQAQIVGMPDGLDKAAAAVGNSLKELNETHFIPFFLVITLGTLPIALPGCRKRSSSASLEAPLLLRSSSVAWAASDASLAHAGEYQSRLPRIRHRAFLRRRRPGRWRKILRHVFSATGLQWLLAGACVTVLPLMLIGIFARAVLKMNFMDLSGLLAGSMTDPPALAFASNIAGSDAPTVAYATVYPLTTLLRILSAQVLAIVLFR
jgi:putative transport protein